MTSDVNEIINLFNQKNFSEALTLCEALVEKMKNQFAEALTVNTATDFVGVVLLHARICGAMKKPWKVFPVLESSRGALRFLHDFMSDSETLAETYFSYADAYAYGNFLPEAVTCYLDAARYFESDEKVCDALYSAFFYEARTGKELISDLKFAEVKIGKSQITKLKKDAEKELVEQIATDPVEFTDEFLNIRYEAEQKIDEILSENPSSDLSFCALYWNTKKAVLREHFAIDWKTPAEMNPDIRFY